MATTISKAITAANNPWVPMATRIVDITHEVHGISTYALQFENASIANDYRFLPGQFNMLYLPGFGEAAISISSDPDQPNSLAHTVRVAGNVTRALSRMKMGQQLLLRGPFGTSWPVDKLTGCDVILACGGVGLAPLRPVIYHIKNHRDDYGRVRLLYGARTPSDLLYTNEYDDWRAHDIEVNVTVDLGDDAWTGQIGVVPVLFDRLRLTPSQTRVLTCGPEIMMRFVILEALGRKVRPNHIFLSMERNMNCAIGFCGHCQLGPEFICKDGPVFTYQRMEPYLNHEDL